MWLAGKVEDSRINFGNLRVLYDKCSADDIEKCELSMLEVGN